MTGCRSQWLKRYKHISVLLAARPPCLNLVYLVSAETNSQQSTHTHTHTHTHRVMHVGRHIASALTGRKLKRKKKRLLK